VTPREIYDGSDGDATKALYQRLQDLGPIGYVALNLFRAQKNSARAKVYRGHARGQGSYRGLAYERKEWALANLCTALEQCAAALAMAFGWQRDDGTPGFPWVLYVDLPTGQVSFHAAQRGRGPDYAGAWDQVRDASADRIVRWCEQLLRQTDRPLTSAVDPRPSPALAKDERRAPTSAGPGGDPWCRRCCVWWPRRSRCPGCGSSLIAKAQPVQAPELRPGVRAEWDDHAPGGTA